MDCRARSHVLLARRLESVLCFVGDDKQKHTLNLQSLFAIMGFLDFLLVDCHEIIGFCDEKQGAKSTLLQKEQATNPNKFTTPYSHFQQLCINEI